MVEKNHMDERASIYLPPDALIRSVRVNRALPHVFFLGAGTSISSGVPSAQQCVWKWKRELFLSKHPALRDQFTELSLAGVRARIQRWLDSEPGCPPEGSPQEYSFYIERCYPIPADRAAFFAEAVRSARPHIGYRALAVLAEMDFVRYVFTTNFDGLVSKALAASSVAALEVALDSAHRLGNSPKKGELCCVALHGDYKYDAIKNTNKEVQQQELLLVQTLRSQLIDAPCIVSGYSGRDNSVMEVFADAYSRPGTGTLYWCGIQDEPAPAVVASLIEAARSAGRQAYYVQTSGFDDLIRALALHCPDSLSARELEARLGVGTSLPESRLEHFTVPDYPIAAILKSNAFEIECPSEIYAFSPNKWPPSKCWDWLRDVRGNADIVVAPHGGKVLAMGMIDVIKDTFRDIIHGEIERVPVSEHECRNDNGVVLSMFGEALVRAIGTSRSLSTDGRHEIWDSRLECLHKTDSTGRPIDYYASMLVYFRWIMGRLCVVFKPSIRVFEKNGEPASDAITKDVRLRILAGQYNRQFNQALNSWRNILFVDREAQTTFEFPVGVASTFRFRVRRTPLGAGIGNPRAPHDVPLGMPPHLLKQRGVELPEPSLVFAGRSEGCRAKDTHPIRGLATNRPFDHSLTLSGLAKRIRIGVVCPKRETATFARALDRLMQRIQPNQKEPDYLLPYPGFESAFGLPIDIPTPDSEGWFVCPEPTGSTQNALVSDVARNLGRGVEALSAKYAPNVTLLFFPQRWKGLQRVEDEFERLDVHDFVKALAVEKGLATQFIEEKTLADLDPCRVWWWLSLALYAKSMRTPWVLDCLDERTAFVGIGYAVNRNSPKGKHVVLGCSHIYDSRGEGLQYRLSKVENPVFHGKNPFLSEEDAMKTGETIRQLFFDSRHCLPDRVVLHKKTPFLRQERDGLLRGLEGVRQVELLEIQEDSALRYVASVVRQGRIDEDNYPVRRGTVVKLDERASLLWVHGSSDAADGRRRYYQGKRRIPAPLMIRRHLGSSDLTQIATEILGLSKMNWNTFDLYTKSPATLQSSGTIARIGSLLDRFGSRSYDFRLFM